MTSERSAEAPIAHDLLTDVLWQRVGHTSLEHFRLSKVLEMYVLQGVLLSRAETVPQQIHYAVACGTDWITRHVHVTMIAGSRHQRLELQRDQYGVWRRGSEVLPAFDGISDVDLQITPATNTLPIRRLQLGVGEAADTDALWVRFPGLELDRLPQRYTRTAEKQYTYESGSGEFRAKLDVDDEGVVVQYGDIWRQA
jgi:uncharacterized protein